MVRRICEKGGFKFGVKKRVGVMDDDICDDEPR